MHRSLFKHAPTTFLSFSSSTSTSPTLTAARDDLRKHLRQLYHKIHPDRLAQHPDERLVNQSSFQDLQSALDPHLKPNPSSSRPAHPPTASAVRKLTFFSKPISQEGSHRLVKTNVNFHETRLASALIDLFEALGLEAPSHSTLSAVFPSSARSGTTTNRAHLRDLVDRARRIRNPFVRDASSTTSSSHTHTQASSSSPDEGTLLLHALQRRHGISIEIEPYQSVQPLIVLRRLAGALADLDEHGDSIRPSILRLHAGKTAQRLPQPEMEDSASLSGSDAVQAVPVLELGAMAPNSSWRMVLDCPDLSADCTAARAYAQQLHVIQVLAARVLGVRLVLCEVDPYRVQTAGEIRLLRDYEILIRDVCCQNKATKLARTGRSTDLKKLAVMITEGSSVKMDVEHGVLKVGVQCQMNGLYKAIDGAGGIARRYARECQRKADEAQMKESVRRELRLERLRRADGISDSEWAMALNKLRRDSGVLREVLAGMSVAIGSDTRLLRGGEVELAHDFELRDL